MASESRSRSSAFRTFSVFKLSQDGAQSTPQPHTPPTPTNSDDPWSLKDLETMFTSWDPVTDSPPVPDPLPCAPPTAPQTSSSRNHPRLSPRSFRGAIGFRSHKSRDTFSSQSDTFSIPTDPHSRPSSSLSYFSPQSPPVSPAQMKNDSASTKTSPKNGAAKLIKSVSNDLKRSINGSKRKTVAVSRLFSNGKGDKQPKYEGKVGQFPMLYDGAVEPNVIPQQPVAIRTVPRAPSFNSLRSNETLKTIEDESSSPSTSVPTAPDTPISYAKEDVAPPLPEKDGVYLLPTEVPASVTVKQMILPHRASRTVDPALLEAMAAESGISLDRALLEEVLGEWGATTEIYQKGLEMHGQRSLDARAGMIKLYRERLMKIAFVNERACEVGVVEGVNTQIEAARVEEEVNRWMYESARKVPAQKSDNMIREALEKFTIETEKQSSQEVKPTRPVPNETGSSISVESSTSSEVTEVTGQEADVVETNVSVIDEEVPVSQPSGPEVPVNQPSGPETAEVVVPQPLDPVIEESAEERAATFALPEEAARQTSKSPSPRRPTSGRWRIPQFANRRTSAYSATTTDPAPRDLRRFSSATQLFSFSRSPSASTVVAPPPSTPTPRAILRTDEEIASLESESNSHEFTRAAASLELIALRHDEDLPPTSRIASPRISKRPETHRNLLLPREQQMKLVARVQPGARVALRRGKDGSVQLWAATSVEVERHPPPMHEPALQPVTQNIDEQALQQLQMQDPNGHLRLKSEMMPTQDPNAPQNAHQQLYAVPVQQPDGTLMYQYYFVPPENPGELEQSQNLEALPEQTQKSEEETYEQSEIVMSHQNPPESVELPRTTVQPPQETAVSA
ncbi:hypothetical protein BJ742DRAFT_814557 [Cladochytrium replicatum]|nr:hypothetical protein BJ742DRAFT_814557 [Cladochytrium replicatum]